MYIDPFLQLAETMGKKMDEIRFKNSKLPN